jgi:hypothetical protein
MGRKQKHTKVERDPETKVLVQRSMTEDEIEEMRKKKSAFDRSEPWADEDGLVPEFVNVSGKIQNMCVPWQTSQTIQVLPLGILRGAQWREPYTKKGVRPWGDHPYFIERVRGSDKKFDSSYVLTVDQAVEHLKSMRLNLGKFQKMSKSDLHEIDLGLARSRLVRIREFVSNMKIVDGEPDKKGYDARRIPRLIRDREDRGAVLKVESDVVDEIEQVISLVNGSRGY